MCGSWAQQSFTAVSQLCMHRHLAKKFKLKMHKQMRKLITYSRAQAITVICYFYVISIKSNCIYSYKHNWIPPKHREVDCEGFLNTDAKIKLMENKHHCRKSEPLLVGMVWYLFSNFGMVVLPLNKVCDTPCLSETRGAAPADLVVKGLFQDRKGRPGGVHQGGSGGAAAGSHPDWPGPAYHHSRLKT